MIVKRKKCNGSHPVTDEDHINIAAAEIVFEDGITYQLWESSRKQPLSGEGEEGSVGCAKLCVCVCVCVCVYM